MDIITITTRDVFVFLAGASIGYILCMIYVACSVANEKEKHEGLRGY